jgi:hypothetical protein
MVEKTYYYLDPVRNQAVGPYTADELRRLHVSGSLRLEQQVAEAGSNSWRPLRDFLILSTGAPGDVAPPIVPVVPLQSNPAAVSVGGAILWFFLCMPVGFTLWGQGAKGWVWFAITVVTFGFGALAAIVDYWMCFSAQQTRKVRDWEFFPQ